MKVINFEAS